MDLQLWEEGELQLVNFHTSFSLRILHNDNLKALMSRTRKGLSTIMRRIPNFPACDKVRREFQAWVTGLRESYMSKKERVL